MVILPKSLCFLGTFMQLEEIEQRLIKVEEFTFRTNARDYSIIAGVHKEDSRYFFHGEIAMLTMNIGEHAIKGMKDIQELYSIYPMVVFACGAGFAQCGFIGKAIHFCTEQDKRDQLVLKSVLLVNSEEIKVCVELRGLIKSVKIRQSIECLNEENLERLLEEDMVSLNENQDLCRSE